MSFAVWKEKPPFTFDEKDREQVYQVGAVWVVTDDPKRATQAEVDKVLNPLPAAKSISDGQLAAVLVAKGVVSQADVDAAVDVAAAPKLASLDQGPA